MLMQEPNEEMIKEWQDIYNKNKDKLKPNKKDGLKIVEYLDEDITNYFLVAQYIKCKEKFNI